MGTVMQLNEDQPHRNYRLIEVLNDRDLKRSWALVDGWLELAEKRAPGRPKAVLEGDFLVRLPSGAVYKEVSFKSEHTSVPEALPDWAAAAGRRWGHFVNGVIYFSDGVHIAASEVTLEVT